MTRDVAEHTLPTGNQPRMCQNTLCQPEIDPGHGGTHSADRKLTIDVAEIDPGHGGTHSANRKLIQDKAEHTLPTGNQPGTRQNTFCNILQNCKIETAKSCKILQNPAKSNISKGPPFASNFFFHFKGSPLCINFFSFQRVPPLDQFFFNSKDTVEHTLSTGNLLRMQRNTLC